MVGVRMLATIGVYGLDVDAFLDALRGAGVDRVMDVRQRRGVRGPQYAWANSLRLQGALAAAGFGYSHHPELAPTTELRQLQYREDDRTGVGKRNRVELAAEYRRRYVAEVLDRVDLGRVFGTLPAGAVPALLCVERDAAACHRSLIAERAHEEMGVPIVHLPG
jgi:uncharacterized protein (DUF488 family)